MNLNTKQLVGIARYILSTRYQIGEDETIDALLASVTHKANLIAEAGRYYTANKGTELTLDRVRNAIDLIEME